MRGALSDFTMTNAASFRTAQRYVIGLDLGQANDSTALTVLKQIYVVVEGEERPHEYEIPHLQRFKLGTPYPAQVDSVCKIFRALPELKFPPILVVDATGVGRPVVDLLRKAGLTPIAVTISGGISETKSTNFRYSVPKRNLVSSLQVVFQTGRIRIAKSLPEAPTLVNELQNFKVKISVSGHDTYEAWRECVHVDLVLSASLAVWFAERHRPMAVIKNFGFMER